MKLFAETPKLMLREIVPDDADGFVHVSKNTIFIRTKNYFL